MSGRPEGGRALPARDGVASHSLSSSAGPRLRGVARSHSSPPASLTLPARLLRRRHVAILHVCCTLALLPDGQQCCGNHCQPCR